MWVVSNAAGQACVCLPACWRMIWMIVITPLPFQHSIGLLTQCIPTMASRSYCYTARYCYVFLEAGLFLFVLCWWFCCLCFLLFFLCFWCFWRVCCGFCFVSLVCFSFLC